MVLLNYELQMGQKNFAGTVIYNPTTPYQCSTSVLCATSATAHLQLHESTA